MFASLSASIGCISAMYKQIVSLVKVVISGKYKNLNKITKI